MASKKYRSSKSIKILKGIQNDQFYTNPTVAEELSNFIKQQPWFNNIEYIIEPSAGTGNFSSLFPNCIAYDIDPKSPDIIQSDFLTLDIEYKSNTLIVGNPPFGRQGSLAIKFFKKSCEIADHIAFVLPKSFLKISTQNKLPLSHSLLNSILLKEDSFILENGSKYDVPCVFQIWHKQERDKILNKNKCEYFSWTKKEECDFAIRRVGFYAGKLIEDFQSTSEQSHYYIKCNCDLNLIKTIFNKINFNHYSDLTTGPKSISKSELVELFENELTNL